MRAGLLDAKNSGLSLRRVLAQIGEYPQLLHDKVGDRGFTDDCNLKAELDPHFSRHERTPSALASTHRALDDAIDAMISAVKTYYWIVGGISIWRSGMGRIR
ncbi:MAG TPA: hypothetical protein VF742_13625 [Terracidiphilus sp.]